MDERLIQEAIDMLESLKMAKVEDVNIELSKFDDGSQRYSVSIDFGSGTFIKTKDGYIYVND